MSRQSMASKDPDIIASIKALRRAARQALELGLRTGTPVYVMQDGKIVDLTKQAPVGSQYSSRPAAAAVCEPKTKYSAKSFPTRPTSKAKPLARRG